MTTATLSSKSRIVLPRIVRDHIGVGPGDEIDLKLVPGGAIVRRRGTVALENPFAVFSEWSGEADEKAYHQL